MKEISLNPPGGAVPPRMKFLLKASSSTSPNDTACPLVALELKSPAWNDECVLS